MTDDIKAYLDAGETTLSNVLFNHYADTDLTPQEFIVYLFLTHWHQRHQQAPALDALGKAVRLRPNETYGVVNSLIKKKAIQLISIPDKQGKMVDQYDVTPLLQQLLAHSGAATAKPVAQPAEDSGQKVFSQIEIEFGRPLSPIEQQTINDWLNVDHYEPALIALALREAVLNQAYSLRYMDRILLNWEKRNLKTAQQVQADQAKRNEL